MMLAYPVYGDQFVLFTETELSDQAIVGYLDAAEQVSKMSRTSRRADAIGTFQALTGLWQILVRQDQIPVAQAEPTLLKMVNAFIDLNSDDEVFEAGRDGVLALLAAAGVPAEASPQDALMNMRQV